MQHLQSRIRPIETIEALQNRIARTILFKSVHLPYKLARQDILFKTLLSPYSSADLRNIQELVSELSKQTGRICLHTTNMAVYQRKNNCWQPELFDFLKMIVVLLFGVCIVPVWAPRKKFVLSIPSIVGQFPHLYLASALSSNRCISCHGATWHLASEDGLAAEKLRNQLKWPKCMRHVSNLAVIPQSVGREPHQRHW